MRRNRRSIRLDGYDYRQPGAYFVTVCTHQHEHLLGSVYDKAVVLSTWGQVVEQYLLSLPDLMTQVRLDAFVIMPNHLHVIFWIISQTDALSDIQPPALSVGQPGLPAVHPSIPSESARPTGVAAGSLGAIVGNLKAVTARRINQLRRATGMPVWQRNYFEHIVRSDEALFAIRRYIIENPKRWSLDRYHPNPTGPDPRAAEIWRLLHDQL